MPKPVDIPECPGVPKRLVSAVETRDYSIRLVTPLFGGGVRAGDPDPSLPIRSTSIRGQLQFWWRATRGAACSDRKELFSLHAEIWGTTDKASPVQIKVAEVEACAAQPCAEYKWDPSAKNGKGAWRLNWLPPFRGTALPYALFPFQGQPPEAFADAIPEKAPAAFIATASFRLCVSFPAELLQDVQMALSAWLNFGGIGARTRRGCGSVYCAELAPPNVPGLAAWFRTTFGATGERRDWPTLPDLFLTRTAAARAMDCWNEAIQHWRHFRQGPGFARNPGKSANHPGRSRYPESETIRELPESWANRQISGHQRLAQIPVPAFPRAELGLPIVFHFQGKGEPPGNPRSPDFTLYPDAGPNGEKRERMASPVILKPLGLGDGQAVPIILVLLSPRLSAVDLRQGANSIHLPTTPSIRGHALSTYRDSPLAGTPSGSAIEAFLARARGADAGFYEVTR